MAQNMAGDRAGAPAILRQGGGKLSTRGVRVTRKLFAKEADRFP